MICVLMCGGKGTRMNVEFNNFKIEKPLIKLKNIPLIEYIINSIIETGLNLQIYAAVSPNTKKTRQFLMDNFFDKITLLETSGIEYSKDYLEILNYFKNKKFNHEEARYEYKIIFLPIDMPLLSSDILINISRMEQKNPCLVIVLERKHFQKYDIDPSYEIELDNKKYHYSGISVVDISKFEQRYNKENMIIEEEYKILNNSELAININTIKDLNKIEKLLECYKKY